MKILFPLLVSFYLQGALVLSRPLSSHVTCDLISVLSSNKTPLLERTVVMNGPVVPAANYLYAFQTNKSSANVGHELFITVSSDGYTAADGFIVQTPFPGAGESSTLAINSSTTATIDNVSQSCWIIYNAKPGNVFLWSFSTDDAVIRIIHSSGFGTGIQFNVITAATAKDVAAEIGSDDDEDDGKDDDGSEDTTDDVTGNVTFKIAISLLTIGYGIFVWYTLEPLTVAGFYK